MSAYNPPIYNNAIFNTEDFEEANPTTLTIDYADGHYLKFPYAQGNETFQDKSITFSETATPSSSTISQSTGNLVIAGNEASSNTIIKSKDPSGTDITTFQVNYAYVTVNTSSGVLIENNKSIVLSGRGQNTTYTGWVGFGTNTYSNPSITINDNGKITAISSTSIAAGYPNAYGTVIVNPTTGSGIADFGIYVYNQSSWDYNAYFTLRVSFVINQNLSGSPSLYQNNYSISGYVNVYPKRNSIYYGDSKTLTGYPTANLNNNIDGNTSFTGVVTSTGYHGQQIAPNGRVTWFYNGAVGTNSFVYVTGDALATNQITFLCYNPISSSGSTTPFQVDCFMELIDKGGAPSGSRIQTSGSGFTQNFDVTY